MLKRLAMTMALVWSPTAAWADAAADCSQKQYLDRRIGGCTEFIQNNPRSAESRNNRGITLHITL